MATAPILKALKQFGECSMRSFSHLKHLPLLGLVKFGRHQTFGICMVRKCSSSNLPSGFPDIQTFYKDRNVLVTGVTGFVGKALVEKLLRSCIHIGKVYVLIRPQKGLDAHKRLKVVLSSKIFDRMKEEQPAAIQKLVAINGDTSKLQLGLDEVAEKELIENVSVVFHAAAIVKFDEKFRIAVLNNTGGVVNIVELCKKLKYLKALISVSTAYSQCMRGEVDEIIYPTAKDPVGIVKTFQQEWMTDDMVKAIEPLFMKDQHSHYTFSKALSETVLLNEGKHLPVAIVRPSIVVASWKEPYLGWVDSIYGSTGMQVMLQKGILRTVYMNADKVADYIPVDVCVNLLIAVAWHLAHNPYKDVVVYNNTSGSIRPITWGQLLKQYNHYAREYPVHGVVWYPNISPKRFKFHHQVCAIFFHYIPAFCLDTIARLMGQKPMLMKVHQKMYAVFNALELFMNNDWKFKTDNEWNVWEAMSAEDKQEFDFDIRQLDWTKYCENYTLGIKQYLLKEDLAKIPEAHQHLKRLKRLRNLTYLLGILMSGSLLGVTFNLI